MLIVTLMARAMSALTAAAHAGTVGNRRKSVQDSQIETMVIDIERSGLMRFVCVALADAMWVVNIANWISSPDYR